MYEITDLRFANIHNEMSGIHVYSKAEVPQIFIPTRFLRRIPEVYCVCNNTINKSNVIHLKVKSSNYPNRYYILITDSGTII